MTRPIIPEAIVAEAVSVYGSVAIKDEHCQGEVILSHDAMEAALFAVCSKLQVDRWVAVKERLPDPVLRNGIDFLTWNGEWCAVSDVNPLLYGGQGGFFTNASPKVTHWMPLPAPPEKKS